MDLKRDIVAYYVSEMGQDEYEEEAADVGGPKREFFSIVAETLLYSTNPQLFEGDVDHKLPTHNQQLLLESTFLMTGKAFGHGYLHAQQQIHGLARPVRLFLATGCPETAAAVASIEDVADMEVRECSIVPFRSGL